MQQAKTTSLAAALGEALYGSNPDEVAARREAVKQVLRRAIDLVDAGKLGCIILTELEDVEGSSVRMTPIGDSRLILQTAKQLLTQALKKQEPVTREPDPSQ